MIKLFDIARVNQSKYMTTSSGLPWIVQCLFKGLVMQLHVCNFSIYIGSVIPTDSLRSHLSNFALQVNFLPCINQQPTNDSEKKQLYTIFAPKVMRKYMNFNEESRMEVTQPEVVSFVMNKSEQLAGSISASVILLVFCCWELTAVSDRKSVV